MTQQVAELYTALIQVGVTEETARAAARSVIAIEDKESLASKADVSDLRLAVKADIAELKAELTWRIFLILSLQTAVFSAIVAALKFVRP